MASATLARTRFAKKIKLYLFNTARKFERYFFVCLAFYDSFLASVVIESL